jgi:hypothetical protein
MEIFSTRQDSLLYATLTPARETHHIEAAPVVWHKHPELVRQWREAQGV